MWTWSVGHMYTQIKYMICMNFPFKNHWSRWLNHPSQSPTRMKNESAIQVPEVCFGLLHKIITSNKSHSTLEVLSINLVIIRITGIIFFQTLQKPWTRTQIPLLLATYYLVSWAKKHTANKFEIFQLLYQLLGLQSKTLITCLSHTFQIHEVSDKRNQRIIIYSKLPNFSPNFYLLYLHNIWKSTTFFF